MGMNSSLRVRLLIWRNLIEQDWSERDFLEAIYKQQQPWKRGPGPERDNLHGI